jgi:hypothetical protein
MPNSADMPTSPSTQWQEAIEDLEKRANLLSVSLVADIETQLEKIMDHFGKKAEQICVSKAADLGIQEERCQSLLVELAALRNVVESSALKSSGPITPAEEELRRRVRNWVDDTDTEMNVGHGEDGGHGRDVGHGGDMRNDRDETRHRRNLLGNWSLDKAFHSRNDSSSPTDHRDTLGNKISSGCPSSWRPRTPGISLPNSILPSSMYPNIPQSSGLGPPPATSSRIYPSSSYPNLPPPPNLRSPSPTHWSTSRPSRGPTQPVYQSLSPRPRPRLSSPSPEDWETAPLWRRYPASVYPRPPTPRDTKPRSLYVRPPSPVGAESIVTLAPMLGREDRSSLNLPGMVGLENDQYTALRYASTENQNNMSLCASIEKQHNTSSSASTDDHQPGGRRHLE